MPEELIVFSHPKSELSEAIKTIRTNINFSSVDERIKTILVTSSIPGEGKSFISANLATAFAQAGQKVLLIDCDLRKGRQSVLFGLINCQDKGLSNLLLEEKMIPENYIKETVVPNLYLLPKGTVTPNPAELLESKKNRFLLARLKCDYDLIILDCPPLNGLNDALVLTPIVDTCILVSALKKTPINALMESKKALEKVGATVAGLIVNKVPAKSNGYYGDYYSKYYSS